MKPFTVQWEKLVLGALADIWIDAPDRQAVTQAEAAIERLLERDPLNAGEHLSEGLYRLDVHPLRVFFTVDTDKALVQVTGVKYRP